VRALSFREILVTCVVIVCLICSAQAQDQQAPQGGGQQPPTPQPNPQPQPQPRQPAVTPAPQPSILNNNQDIFIRGRIITGAQGGGPPIIEVRVETDGGQPIGFAYADSAGEFNFRKNGFNADQTVYVVVNLDGFKPHRERIFGGFGGGIYEGSLNIFLERETNSSAPDRGAVVDLKQLRANNPPKAVDEYEKALKESTKGNRSKAVEGLQRAIKLAPDFYEAQHTLGVQFLALQKYDDAEKALTRARDLSPKAAEPLINLGSLYYQRGEGQLDAGHPEEAMATFEKAADLLDEAIRRSPLSASAHTTLGAALYKIGSYEEAETALNKALQLDDNEQNARLMLINVYTKGARYNDALEQANIFIAKNPKAPQRASLEAIKQQIEKVLAK